MADVFGPEFQRLLVRACVDDPALCGLVERFSAPGQLRFGDATARWAWQVVQAEEHPTLLALQEASRRLDATDPARIGLRDVLDREVDWRESQYLRGRVGELARTQVFRRAYNESSKHFNAGDLDEACRVFERVMAESDDFRMEHLDRRWFFDELDDRQDRRFHWEASGKVFPLGVGPLDKRLGGGAQLHTLTTLTGFSNVGKSFLLSQVGFLGARMRHRVLHFIMEGSTAQTADRYEARFTGQLYFEVRRGAIEPQVMERIRSEYRFLKNRLVIRGWGDKADSTRVRFDELRQEMRELRSSKGWVPTLVLVDIPDLLYQPGVNGTYEQQTESFRQMRSLADAVDFPGHEGYAVVVTTHAKAPDKNSGIEDTEYVLDESWTGNSIAKYQLSDTYVTINRSRQEEKEEKARLFLCKSRESERHLLVRVSTDMGRGAFSKLGVEPEIVHRRVKASKP